MPTFEAAPEHRSLPVPEHWTRSLTLPSPAPVEALARALDDLRPALAFTQNPNYVAAPPSPGFLDRYGYAVLDEPGPRRQTRNDSILWSASIAKLLVAVAVLQQLEKGRLALDDDINLSVPFIVRNPKWLRRNTVSQSASLRWTPNTSSLFFS